MPKKYKQEREKGIKRKEEGRTGDEAVMRLCLYLPTLALAA